MTAPDQLTYPDGMAHAGDDPHPSEATRLRQLRAFVAVADAGSIGRAAEQLGTTQPPLSRLILRLERGLGHALLHRHRRGVALTAAGATLLPAARRVLDAVADFDHAVAGMTAGRTGMLRVGTTEGAAALTRDTLRAYRDRHPDVEVRLHHAHTPTKLDMLRRGELDVAFVRYPTPTSGVQLTHLVTEPLVAVLAADHPLAHRPDITLADLAAYPLLLTPQEVNPAVHNGLLDCLHRRGITPRLGPPLLTELDGLTHIAATQDWTLLSEPSTHTTGPSITTAPIADADLTVTITLAWRTHPDTLATDFIHAARAAADTSTRQPPEPPPD